MKRPLGQLSVATVTILLALLLASCATVTDSLCTVDSLAPYSNEELEHWTEGHARWVLDHNEIYKKLC